MIRLKINTSLWKQNIKLAWSYYPPFSFWKTCTSVTMLSKVSVDFSFFAKITTYIYKNVKKCFFPPLHEVTFTKSRCKTFTSPLNHPCTPHFSQSSEVIHGLARRECERMFTVPCCFELTLHHLNTQVPPFVSLYYFVKKLQTLSVYNYPLEF